MIREVNHRELILVIVVLESLIFYGVIMKGITLLHLCKQRGDHFIALLIIDLQPKGLQTFELLISPVILLPQELMLTEIRRDGNEPLYPHFMRE
jgi:hypothetical protein